MFQVLQPTIFVYHFHSPHIIMLIFRLCLEAVFAFRDCNVQEWKNLPRLLKDWLLQKKKGMDIVSTNVRTSQENRAAAGQSTCTLS